MKNFTLTMLSMLFATGLWAQNCSNLFFSEYIEGSSFNKAVEIYNPTPNTINLSNYRLILRGFTASGTTPFTPDTLQLSGTIASGGVYIVSNPDNTEPTILALSDDTAGVINFNGNDAIALLDVSLGQIIDAVGDYSATANPGADWTVGAGSTKDNTLVRKSTVQAGTSNWTVGATQWDVFPNNTVSNLGSHASTCFVITDTFAVFSPTSKLVIDTAATTTINIRLVGLSSTPANNTIELVLKQGDATWVNNFTTQTVIIAAATATAEVTINLTPNTATTPDTLVFALRNPAGNLQVGADSLFTLIIDTLRPTAIYTIAQLRGANTDGLPDSLGTVGTVTGTVLGINLRNGGLNFTINDGTAGIGVFNPTGNLGYTVQEGDSISVTGKVEHFNGYAQMGFLSNITVLGTGTLPSPRLVTDLNEDTEGDLIEMQNMRIIGTPTGTNPKTYDITNGVDSFEMVVYDATLISTSFPARFTVIGLGRQFDSGGGVPVRHTRFYQIAPRKQADIINTVGMDELSAGVTAVYPNPATNLVNIVLEANIQVQSVKVFDFTGRLVLEQGANSASTVKMDISNLNSGLYLVQVATAKGISTHKVVKQ